MGEPIVSSGKGRPPSPAKRAKLAKRAEAAQRAAAPNPVKILPRDAGRRRVTTRFSYADTVGPAPERRNATARGARQSHRYDRFDGELIAARYTSTCSACSARIPSGEACWFNPRARWVTCTTCRPVE